MEKRVVITLGGTGGHVYPGVALAEELGVEVLFIGGKLKSNRFFAKEKYPFEEVACGTSLKQFWGIFKGFCQSVRLLRRYKPHVVVGFGSYYTVPTLLAAWVLRIPIILHEANAVPGRVNRLFSRVAVVTGVHFDETIGAVNGKAAMVGMPLRKGFEPDSSRKEGAYRYFGLDPKKQTVFISGGSQGAEAISRVAVDAIPEGFQVLHLTGKEDSPYAHEYSQKGIGACVKPFETQMELAWEVADIAVSRSGAGTLAEMQSFHVPGVFIPFPRASDNHQEINADLMVKRGYGVKISEGELTPQSLRSALSFVLSDVVEAKPKQTLSNLVKEHL